MTESQTVLPGDNIPQNNLPQAPKRKIGHGITSQPGSTDFTATIAGTLNIDFRKKSANITNPTARYLPKAGDLVIAQIRGTSTETFHLYINPFSPPAILSQLAFEGASKKSRPNLKNNDIVYAKVISAQKNMDIELSCVNPSTGKADPDGLGPLSGGMVIDVSVGFAERLLRKKGVVVLDELGSKMQGGFELAIGRNGKVWVNCPSGVRGTCAVIRCLRITDEEGLSEEQQMKMVKKVLKELESG